jgi:hypothetical protein
MESLAAFLEGNLFCDRCGLQFEPKRPVCAGCGVTPTRQWFQLMSLVTLVVALVCNSLVGLFLLPRLISEYPHRPLFRVWLWLDEKSSLYGWFPMILGLLAWDHFVWQRSRARGSKPQIKRWATRKVLSFVLAAAGAPLIPWWIPSLQPSDKFLSMISRYPGLPSTMAWVTIVFVAALLCSNARTRDSLLGHGRILSLISLGILLVVVGMTLVSWALSY